VTTDHDPPHRHPLPSGGAPAYVHSGGLLGAELCEHAQARCGPCPACAARHRAGTSGVAEAGAGSGWVRDGPTNYMCPQVYDLSTGIVK
jgi:hypothetical protein